MSTYRQTIEIKTLEPIKNIMVSLTNYLPHSEPLRNAAYLIQLESFLSQIPVDRGLALVHKYNLLRIKADVTENLLYCALKTLGLLPKNVGRNKPGLQAYANKAKTRGLISKSTWSKVDKACLIRNSFHPSRQAALITKIPQKNIDVADIDINKLVREINNYFEDIIRNSI